MSEDVRMKDLRQWVCWRHEERGGKPTKVPYSPRFGARASTENPFTWGTFDEAKHTSTQSYDGVGFVFTAQDAFCGVDLDRCLNPGTGQIDPWATEILDDLDSYTEVSPSGTGLHVIVRARLPEGGRRKDRIEMYDRARFFTVTGRHLPGASRQVEHRQDRIDALHTRVFHDTALDLALSSVPSAAAPGNGLDDEEILRRARSAANGERFAALWKGDRSGYASDSEADLALCSMLALWAGPDEGRISSLFSRSGLMREKWDREDYRKRTIARALAGTTSFYSPDRNAPERNPSVQVEGGGTVEAPVPVPPPSLPEAPAFPVGAMPASCRPLIQEAETALGCAPELVALPMLAVLSSAIGTARIIEVKGGWREWAALFVAVVASPGAMKTPAAKVAKRPAFDRQRKLGKEYAGEKDDWKREMREWEVERRDAQKNGEPAPEEPTAPSMSRCVASDTTVEALVGILEDNIRGLLVHKDELAGWVRSMDQYKGGKGSDRQHWLSFWSGDEVVVDRKSRMGEPLIVAKPFVSLFGGIQPAMLVELGGGSEDGLMDRFLFAYPKTRHVRFSFDEMSEAAEARYAALYTKLAGLPLATDEHGDPNPKPLRLSPEAKEFFARTVDALSEEMLQPGFSGRLEGVWSKLRGYLARLSLVLAVCRCTEASPGAREERVEREDVEAASRLLAYFKAHARRVYAELSAPDSLDLLAGELRDLLEESDGRWEGSATDLKAALAERGAANLPERAEELSKLALRIGERSPALKVSQGWRKIGGRGGRSTRVLKLSLTERPFENAVGPVVTANPQPRATVSNNGNLGALASAGDNGTNGNNGNLIRKSNQAANTNNAEPGDGRSRFTT